MYHDASSAVLLDLRRRFKAVGDLLHDWAGFSPLCKTVRWLGVVVLGFGCRWLKVSIVGCRILLMELLCIEGRRPLVGGGIG